MVIVAIVLFLPLGGYAIPSDKHQCGPVCVFFRKILGKFFIATGMSDVTLRRNLIQGVGNRILHDCRRHRHFRLPVKWGNDEVLNNMARFCFGFALYGLHS